MIIFPFLFLLLLSLSPQSDERERVDMLASKLKQMATHCQTHEKNNGMLRQMVANRDRQVELGKLQIGQLSKLLAAKDSLQ